MIRDALPGEYPEATGEVRLVSLDGDEVKGLLCISRIQVKDEIQCWVHDLYSEGLDAAALMKRARNQAAEWDFEKIWANVMNPELALSMQKRGWKIEQVVLSSPEGWVTRKSNGS